MEIKEALDCYIRRGFGSMTKNDFEVWIFNELLKGDLKSKSNYEISRVLQIPESKVKRLRYEADLRYSSIDDTERRLYEILNQCLTTAHIKDNGNDVQVQFAIEDRTVRKHLEFKLKQYGDFVDSSFNSEIISVRSDGLKRLYESTLQGQAEFKVFEERLKANPDKKGGTFKEFLKGLATGIGSGSASAAVNLSLHHLLS